MKLHLAPFYSLLTISLLTIGLLALAPVAACAQLGVYVNFTAQHVGAATGQVFGGAGNLSNGIFLYGPTFGLQKNFAKLGPLHFGADLRGSILSNGDARLNCGLGGLRISAKPPVLPIRPYVEASAGVGGFNYGRKQALTNSFQYEIDGGADITILPRVDWRVVEFGGGALTASGPGANAGNGLFHISTGLVFRLPF